MRFLLAALMAVSAAFGIGQLVAAPTAQAAGVAALGGGSGIVINDERICSLTTIGHDNSGALVGLTAGHCGNVGDPVVPEYDEGIGVVGHFVVSDQNLDYAVIAFDPGRVLPLRTVGNTTITDIGRPVDFGTVVCKEGRTTGNTCGVTWGDIFEEGTPLTQTCVMEGDSGGPIVRGTTLVGMVNAYLLAPCIGPQIGNSLEFVLGAINHNGGPGSGYRPI